MDTAGSLVLVATPIGNLGDISPRAAEVLASADVIYCEDTRHSRKLLSHLKIEGKPLISLHEHNEERRIEAVVERVAAGQTVALICDAGTPVVSDPGQRLVAAIQAANYHVGAVPGPSAVIMALAISGLPADRFCFEGFLSTKSRVRRQQLAEIANERRTIVFYEAPHRLRKTVADLISVYSSDRQIVITRELTKLHEEVWSGTLAEAEAHLESQPPRGEYTLVLAGAEAVVPNIGDSAITAALQTEITAGYSRSQAVERVCHKLELPRKRVYPLSLSL